ncbi:MAG: prephenate dehydratase [Myxococcales bacterium FL481]|nr:MAG: prephenate dehydratase [Myxococcales bacterium FL481]
MNDSREPDLAQLRARIDEIDQRFVALIRERMDTVHEVRAAKTADPKAPFVDPERERRVFARWAEHARALDLSPYHVGRILREVLVYSRRRQENLPGASGEARRFQRVGFQGVRACYADLALTKLLAARDGQPAERIGFESLKSLFNALDRGEIDRAIVPVENSTSGAIIEVNELLATRDVVIVDEEIYPVRHCLASVPGSSVETITTVRSHPVALHQCATRLAALPRVTTDPTTNTAKAAQIVAQANDPQLACICSPEAATTYGLEVLEDNVADQPRNQTRFVLLSKTAEPLDERQLTKTSLILSTDHRHGALATCLALFAHHQINLTRLESRPQPERPWEYLFYLDFEGNPSHERIRVALDEIKTHANHVQMLGTYPLRSIERRPIPNQPAPVDKPQAPARSRFATSIRVGELHVGGPEFVLAASIRDPSDASIDPLVASGVKLLYTDAAETDGINRLADLSRHYEIPVATTISRPGDAASLAREAELLCVGADQLADLTLLRALSRLRRPVALTRGADHTVDDLLAAADYLIGAGNNQIVFVEPGVRRLGSANDSAALDVSAIKTIESLSRFPVLVTATSIERSELLLPLALAAAAAGADGLLIDAERTSPAQVDELTRGLAATLASVGRSL